MPRSQDKAWADYSERFRTQALPEMLSSRVMLMLYDGAPASVEEIRFATQVGMMLLLDKPLIVTHPPGVTVPRRLAQAADEVVEVDPKDPASQDRFAAAIQRVKAGLT